MPEPFCKTLEETELGGGGRRRQHSGVGGFRIEPMGDDEGFRLEVERLRDCAVFARNYRARSGWDSLKAEHESHALRLSEGKPKPSPFEIAGARKGESSTSGRRGDIFMTPSTTALSPYMKFGCVSPRVFITSSSPCSRRSMGNTRNRRCADGSAHVERILFVGAGTPNFDKMEGNPICRQIPWNRIVNSSPRGKTRRRVSLGSAAMAPLRLGAGSITSLVTPWRVS